jgi:hypothetical protein
MYRKAACRPIRNLTAHPNAVKSWSYNTGPFLTFSQSLLPTQPFCPTVKVPLEEKLNLYRREVLKPPFYIISIFPRILKYSCNWNLPLCESYVMSFIFKWFNVFLKMLNIVLYFVNTLDLKISQWIAYPRPYRQIDLICWKVRPRQISDELWYLHKHTMHAST